MPRRPSLKIMRTSYGKLSNAAIQELTGSVQTDPMFPTFLWIVGGRDHEARGEGEDEDYGKILLEAAFVGAPAKVDDAELIAAREGRGFRSCVYSIRGIIVQYTDARGGQSISALGRLGAVEILKKRLGAALSVSELSTANLVGLGFDPSSSAVAAHAKLLDRLNSGMPGNEPNIEQIAAALRLTSDLFIFNHPAIYSATVNVASLGRARSAMNRSALMARLKRTPVDLVLLTPADAGPDQQVLRATQAWSVAPRLRKPRSFDRRHSEKASVLWLRASRPLLL